MKTKTVVIIVVIIAAIILFFGWQKGWFNKSHYYENGVEVPPPQ